MGGAWIRVRALRTSLNAVDDRGRKWRVLATDDPVYSPIPVSAYRRLRWAGVLSRNLARVVGLGREYRIDLFYRREQHGKPVAAVAVDPPRAVRKCGCSERRREGVQ